MPRTPTRNVFQQGRATQSGGSGVVAELTIGAQMRQFVGHFMTNTFRRSHGKQFHSDRFTNVIVLCQLRNNCDCQARGQLLIGERV